MNSVGTYPLPNYDPTCHLKKSILIVIQSYWIIWLGLSFVIAIVLGHLILVNCIWP